MAAIDDCIGVVEDARADAEPIKALVADHRRLEARVAELQSMLSPRLISEAPTNDRPCRVWVETTGRCGAWFDARCVDGVWTESLIVHCNRGFSEARGKVLRPSLFLPSTPMPDKSDDGKVS